MSACVQVSKAEEYNTQKPELLGYEEMRQMDPSVLAGGTIAFLFSFPPFPTLFSLSAPTLPPPPSPVNYATVMGSSAEEITPLFHYC